MAVTSHQFCWNWQSKISCMHCCVPIWSITSEKRRTQLPRRHDLNVNGLQQTISNCKDTKQSKFLEFLNNIFISHHGHNYCVLTK
jgi:hypothetical protein